MLAWAPGPPAVSVAEAAATLTLQPGPVPATLHLTGAATLRLAATRPVSSLELVLPGAGVPDGSAPAVSLDSLDAGPGATARLEAAPAPGGDPRVRVQLATPLRPGAPLSIRVGWSRPVADAAGLLLPALPRVAGDLGHHPYTLAVWAPADRLPVASGAGDRALDGPPDRVGVAGAGRTGAAAAVGLAPAPGAAGRRGRALTRQDPAGTAAALDRLAPALRAASGWTLDAIDLVGLPPAPGPPAPRAAEGIAGVPDALGLPGGALPGGRRWARLPAAAAVARSEAIFLATTTGAAGADPVARTWLAGAARAFALSQLAPPDAAAWRGALQHCAQSPAPRALSPEATALSGFATVSARCATPLVVGPMLDDRLGASAAERVRRAVLAPGQVGADRWVAAVLAEDPTAAAWAQRWLVEGHVARVRLDWRTTPVPEGVRVEGRVVSDSPLAGAPVTVRFGTGPRAVELQASGSRPFAVVLPQAPRRATVDPDHRLLAVRPTPLPL